MTRREVIGDAELYLGDCRELALEAASDVVITDPPYGVGFTGKVTKHTNGSGRADVYSDTPEHFDAETLPAIERIVACAPRAAIFSGTRRLTDYPKPADIGGIICPNGGGRSSWGFGCFHPVLFYGRSPYIARGLGARPTATVMYHPGMHVTGENDNPHPCPKPIAFMLWAVDAASLQGETVLDPFMGSGTTGVACIKLGRRFIGIEIVPKYFDIACRRIEQATRQSDLFIAPPKQVQHALPYEAVAADKARRPLA